MKLPQSDSVYEHIASLAGSACLNMNLRCDQLKAEGKEVFKLGLGQAPFPVPPSVVAALKEHAAERDYIQVQGLPALRESVAAFYTRKEGVTIDASQIMVGQGSKELLFLLQMVYDATLLLPTPCWVSYEPQATILKKKVHLIHAEFSNSWKITPQQLNEACEKVVGNKLLILNYPNNPYGTSYTESELKDLTQIARAHGLIILSDEIYGEVHYKAEHKSLMRYYPEGTVVSSSLSKWCGAGGWRLGTFCFPKELDWLKQSMCTVASEMYSSVCAPVQHAAITAYKGNEEIEEYLNNSRKVLESVGLECARILAEKEIKVHDPVGGFYLFIDFENYRETLASHGLTTSVEVCEKLLNDTGVAILPGTVCGRNKNELTARLAFINFDGAKTLEGAAAVGSNLPLPKDFAQKYAPYTIEAMNRIASWVSSL